MATDWSVSEDGLVWTFNMRDDVPWVAYNPATGEATVVTDDDGAPRMVNAHDVEYAVKRTLDPATGSDYAYVTYVIKNAAAINGGDEELTIDDLGVKALDDYTVQFTLEQPAGSMNPVVHTAMGDIPVDLEQVAEIWPPDGKSPAEHTVEAKARDYAFEKLAQDVLSRTVQGW